MTPEQQRALAVARARLRLKNMPDAGAQTKEWEEKIRGDLTGDMSGTDKFFSGAGKAVSDLGFGIKQLTGFASDEEADERKQRDAPLMDTGAGLVGNVAGNVGMAVLPGLGAAGAGKALGAKALAAGGKYLMASPATLGGLLTQGGMGALQSGLQPVASGEDRMTNAGVGFLGGAIVPALGMAMKGTKAAVEPLYKGGREQILGRALRSSVGQNVDDVVNRLSSAKQLVPGSAPTAAEVADSGGIAAMQRAASAVDPEAYATRGAQQNEARVAALLDLAGTGQKRSAAEAAREGAAGPLYKQALEQGVDPQAAAALQPQIKNLMQRMPKGVKERAAELARLNGDVMDKGGSVKGLHWMKLAIDDMLSAGKQTGIGKQTERALAMFKDDLLTVMDDLSPSYGQARTTFQQLSKPINQMDVAQEIADKSINKLTGNMQPQSFARALTDDTAARATGFNKATLEGVMDPQQMAMLNALKGDLARSVSARDLGRGAGSDTVQKLAMTNLMERTGIPVGVMNLPLVGRVGNFAYSQVDDQMRQALAKALLSPQETAALMSGSAPNEVLEKLALALRMGATPAAIGTATGALDARQ